MMATVKHVLIVEDDTAVYPLIQRMTLTLNPNAQIVFVDSAEKATELLLGPNAKKYDVVLADLNLAGKKNGVDLVKDVFFKSKRTPFVLATVDKDFVTHLPFLLKPFRYPEFSERMAPYLVDRIDTKAADAKKSRRNLILGFLMIVLLGATYFFAVRS